MTMTTFRLHKATWRPLAACSVLLIAAGCATVPEAPEPAATISVQEDVGFSITETVPVDDPVRFQYDDALRLLQQGRVDEGIAALIAVTEAAPELAAPRIDLGIAYHVAGDLDAAEEQLARAIELNPEHPVAHTELGIVYRKAGRFDEARHSYETAVDVFPGYHHARRNLAILCDLYLGDLDCAMENYEAYMATVPGDDEVEMWMADVRYRLEQ
jgi:tetratricopeptide (TPR) repeat protein